VGVLQRFEQRLERLVQGAFSKAFGGWVEPVEVAAALTREAEDKKAIVGANKVLVPNVFHVELGASDADRLREYDEALRAELASMVGEAAQEQGWSFVGPVEVVFDEVPTLRTGTFRVRSAVQAGETAQEQPVSSYLEVGGQTHPLTGTTVIGRSPDVDLMVPDTGVSRSHCRIEGDVLTDLGSTNGTYVNGRRVSEHTLRDGDRITVGTTDLVYRAAR
jgi:hypothetical protein